MYKVLRKKVLSEGHLANKYVNSNVQTIQLHMTFGNAAIATLRARLMSLC